MSDLGIKNVLPLKGTNGIIINNGKAGLDPNGLANLGALIIGANADDENAICNQQPSTLVVCSSDSRGNCNTQFKDTYSNNNVAFIDTEGGFVNGSNIQSNYRGYVFTDELVNREELITDTITYSGGVVKSNLVGQIDAVVTVDLTKYFEIVINGAVYKLAIVN